MLERGVWLGMCLVGVLCAALSKKGYLHIFPTKPAAASACSCLVRDCTRYCSSLTSGDTPWDLHYMELTALPTPADEVMPHKLGETKKFSAQRIVQLEFGGQHAALLCVPRDAPPPAQQQAQQQQEQQQEDKVEEEESKEEEELGTVEEDVQAEEAEDEAEAAAEEEGGEAPDGDAPAEGAAAAGEGDEAAAGEESAE